MTSKLFLIIYHWKVRGIIANLIQNKNTNNVDHFWLFWDVQTYRLYWKKILKLIYFCLLIFFQCRPYVISIRIKWLAERFYMDAFTDEIIRIAPTLFNLFHFYPDTETWKRALVILVTAHALKRQSFVRSWVLFFIF